MTSFCKYGTDGKSISFDELMELQKETHELWAHAEESGCEGCYCEIARWNNDTLRYERFAFEKFFGGECPCLPDALDVETARHYAELINSVGYLIGLAPVVHRMSNYGHLTELEAAAVKLAEAVKRNPEKYKALEFDSAFGTVCHAGGKLKQEAAPVAS